MRDRRINRCDFKFENAWLEEPELPIVVEGSWNEESSNDFIGKIKSCTNAVDEWGKRLTSRYREAINGCRREIEELRGRDNVGADQRLKEVKQR